MVLLLRSERGNFYARSRRTWRTWRTRWSGRTWRSKTSASKTSLWRMGDATTTPRFWLFRLFNANYYCLCYFLLYFCIDFLTKYNTKGGAPCTTSLILSTATPDKYLSYSLRDPSPPLSSLPSDPFPAVHRQPYVLQ